MHRCLKGYASLLSFQAQYWAKTPQKLETAQFQADKPKNLKIKLGFVLTLAACHTLVLHTHTEVGIYKRKQESRKTRKQVLDQESDQEKKKKTFIFSWSSSCFFTFLFSFINSHLRRSSS